VSAVEGRRRTYAEVLERTALDIGDIAKTGLVKIEAIARVAVLALETPAGAGDTESLAHVLECIRDLSLSQSLEVA